MKHQRSWQDYDADERGRYDGDYGVRIDLNDPGRIDWIAAEAAARDAIWREHYQAKPAVTGERICPCCKGEGHLIDPQAAYDNRASLVTCWCCGGSGVL